jgi:hypothetical protein
MAVGNEAQTVIAERSTGVCWCHGPERVTGVASQHELTR